MISDARVLTPITERIEPRRQGAARHYGSHPYFTRRPWNVIQAYINHFTRPGDTVLDPFGGSGVTAVEALFLRRKAIHVDINPLANFIAQQIAFAPVSLGALADAFQQVKESCGPEVHLWQKQSEEFFANEPPPYWHPQGVRLPMNADVDVVESLFTRRQLFVLSLILDRINRVKKKALRDLLRFCFSATLAKTNRTFISARNRAESRGGPTIFSVYRYNVPKNPVELDPWRQFTERFENLMQCKRETNQGIGDFYSRAHCRILHASAANLKPLIRAETVDYIFTDPPYGAHIAYLDLSTMWNAWLQLDVTESDRQNEAIEGGDLNHSRAHYAQLMSDSIREMARVLKPAGWLSLVFEHRDGTLYSDIVKTASAVGLHYVNTVSQCASVVWSMHKKKNPLRVLSGELIINFCKGVRPPGIEPSNGKGDFDALFREVANREVQKRGGARTEDVFNHLMVKLLDCGLLLDQPLLLDDLIQRLEGEGCTFDRDTGRWRKGEREGIISGGLFKD